MKFVINDKIFAQYPSLNIGVVVARGIDNNGESPEISQLIKDESTRIRSEFNLDTLVEIPEIKTWQETYRSFGAKPKKYKCSIENLYRLILEGVNLRPINKIVDIYNYVSIKNMVPIGGDDIDKVDGDITLTFAQGSESFQPLNSDQVDNPHPNEVVYSDSKEILCRRWNWRECNKSKMTLDTKNVTLVVEGLSPVRKEKIQSVINELADLVKKYCGGQTQTHLLDPDHKEINIDQ